MLILASASPRRAEILRSAGIAFERRSAGSIDESVIPGEAPAEYVQRLAIEKAAVVPVSGAEIILGADTTVVAEGEILAKPEDAQDAARMLRMLSGRDHQVLTGICLRSAEESIVDLAATTVTFARLDEAEIDEYVATGEAFDKAGAYGIQGHASKFVTAVNGCYFNVVGLPIALVYRHLRQLTAT